MPGSPCSAAAGAHLEGVCVALRTTAVLYKQWRVVYTKSRSDKPLRYPSTYAVLRTAMHGAAAVVWFGAKLSCKTR